MCIISLIDLWLSKIALHWNEVCFRRFWPPKGYTVTKCIFRDWSSNMIELVPSLMNRFHKFPIAVASDTEMAFLQIRIWEKDREYLRFIMKYKEGKWRSTDMVGGHCVVLLRAVENLLWCTQITGLILLELIDEDIILIFIPPPAPWRGGWWELLIALVKDL